MHSSGVLAVVASGLIFGWNAPQFIQRYGKAESGRRLGINYLPDERDSVSSHWIAAAKRTRGIAYVPSRGPLVVGYYPRLSRYYHSHLLGLPGEHTSRAFCRKASGNVNLRRVGELSP